MTSPLTPEEVGDLFVLYGRASTEQRSALRAHLDPTPEEHPGENHEFRTTCLRCGERGMLHVSLITDDEVVTISDRAALGKPR